MAQNDIIWPDIEGIPESEYIHKGVIGLPDSPELSTLDMQRKFDEIAIDVIIPYINGLATDLDILASCAREYSDEGVEAEETRAQEAEIQLAADIDAEETRATAAEGDLSTAIGTEKTRAEAAEADLRDAISRCGGDVAAEVARATAAEGVIANNLSAEITRATAAEGTISAAVTAEKTRAETVESGLSNAVSVLSSSKMDKSVYDSDNDGVVDDSEKLGGHDPAYYAKASEIADFMSKSVYDTNNNGVVDNSEALSGHNADYFAISEDVGNVENLETTATNVVDAINEVKDTTPTVPYFRVDLTTGELMYSEEDLYVFTVNTSTGNLEWEVVA
jgi:hypothetical protein